MCGLRKIKLYPPKEFQFLNRNNNQADFTINGNTGKVKNVEDVTNPKAEHYVLINDPDKVKEYRSIFEHLTYPKYSSVNGGNYWISQQEILETYFEWLKCK